MLTLPFKWKNSRSNEPVKCNNKVFGGDPLPGTPKACFCDDIHKMSHNQITSLQEFNLASANAVLAEASSAKLEIQAKEEEAEPKPKTPEIRLQENKQTERSGRPKITIILSVLLITVISGITLYSILSKQPQISVSAKRILPPHVSPGQDFPVLIRVFS